MRLNITHADIISCTTAEQVLQVALRNISNGYVAFDGRVIEVGGKRYKTPDEIATLLDQETTATIKPFSVDLVEATDEPETATKSDDVKLG
jgi:hypothetical protein